MSRLSVIDSSKDRIAKIDSYLQLISINRTPEVEVLYVSISQSSLS